MQDGISALMQNTMQEFHSITGIKKSTCLVTITIIKIKMRTLNLFRTTTADSSFDQHSIMVNENESHGFKAGVDYYANSKSTIGVMVNGNFQIMNLIITA